MQCGATHSGGRRKLVSTLFSGVSYINKSKTIESLSDHFVEFEAPRTALGVFKNGSVILAEVCICEA